MREVGDDNANKVGPWIRFFDHSTSAANSPGTLWGLKYEDQILRSSVQNLPRSVPISGFKPFCSSKTTTLLIVLLPQWLFSLKPSTDLPTHLTNLISFPWRPLRTGPTLSVSTSPTTVSLVHNFSHPGLFPASWMCSFLSCPKALVQVIYSALSSVSQTLAWLGAFFLCRPELFLDHPVRSHHHALSYHPFHFLQSSHHDLTWSFVHLICLLY